MAMVLDMFLCDFLKLLVVYAKEESALLFGVSKKIKKLITKLRMIHCVLADAERKQLQDEAIKFWLDELKDIMYDAEDIIEEYKYHNTTPSSSSAILPVRSCYTPLACFRRVVLVHKIGKRIKSINHRVDNANKDMVALNLTTSSREFYKSGSALSRRTSLLVEPNVVGSKIRDDKRILVQLLINEHKTKNILIYALTGMGGIGKTTLAQEICRDESLRINFHPITPIWVCVSQEIDETKVLKEVIKGLGGVIPIDAQNKEELEVLLDQNARQKKFFLVLDDVWDAGAWENLLRKPLYNAGAGSRVLVTTRDESIVKEMGAIYRHRVAKMSDEDGWFLLRRMVFTQDDEQEMQAFKELGMKMVSKCDGLPLAVKAISGLLRRKERQPNEWERVLANPIWSVSDIPDGVMKVLHLSYEDLPRHLKQCFLYLAFFPEDYIFKKNYVVQLWIAEGFVPVKEELLELGFDHWRELVNRSLLQPQPDYYKNDGCKMHDLLRALAQQLSRGECWCGHARRLDELPSSHLLLERKPRRLYVVDANTEFFHDTIKSHNACLRTLVAPFMESFSEDEMKSLSRLRILDLQGLATKGIHHSLGNLIHLRSLNLSGSMVKKIPSSIGSLRNLQFLLLLNCKNLQFLPETIESLTKLSVLCTSGTALENMPKGIRKLPELQVLDGLAIGRGGSTSINKDCTLEDVMSFSQLNWLGIRRLERALGGVEARAAALESKTCLTRLLLECNMDSSSSRYDEESIDRIRDVFENMCPPPSLQRLSMNGYFGRGFPSWMMPTGPTQWHYKLSNLIMLLLTECHLCDELPTLGLLPQLQRLLICSASSLVNIGAELFLPSSEFHASESRQYRITSFPKLELLEFGNMPNWEEWRWLDEEKSAKTNLQNMVILPRLRSLGLFGCPKLRSLPHELLKHATALKDLQIAEAHELEVIENLQYIKSLRIRNNSKLKKVAGLSSLNSLFVVGCRNLRVVDGLHELQNISLNDQTTDSAPEWLHAVELCFPKCQKLQVEGRTALNLRPDEDITNIKSDNLDGFSSANYTKWSFSFKSSLQA